MPNEAFADMLDGLAAAVIQNGGEDSAGRDRLQLAKLFAGLFGGGRSVVVQQNGWLTGGAQLIGWSEQKAVLLNSKSPLASLVKQRP